jgi:hypothetical protein
MVNVLGNELEIVEEGEKDQQSERVEGMAKTRRDGRTCESREINEFRPRRTIGELKSEMSTWCRDGLKNQKDGSR